MEIQVGQTFTQEITVRHEDTAAVYGSGKLEVFATPALVALMENTAIRCLENKLDAESDTVGIEINVKHVKATPVGRPVHCKATISEIDGRRIRFEIEAWDDVATIGTAIHDRFVINPVKFMSKLQ
ncbi:MAG: thioesterase family protein [Marinifilaceae bacterium]|nr:thioesterase family protein [Marinifilaceae bacterium]